MADTVDYWLVNILYSLHFYAFFQTAIICICRGTKFSSIFQYSFVCIGVHICYGLLKNQK